MRTAGAATAADRAPGASLPSTGTDSYRYAWDGRVQVAGVSFYDHPPADPALAPAAWRLAAAYPAHVLGVALAGAYIAGPAKQRFANDPQDHARHARTAVVSMS